MIGPRICPLLTTSLTLAPAAARLLSLILVDAIQQRCPGGLDRFLTGCDGVCEAVIGLFSLFELHRNGFELCGAVPSDLVMVRKALCQRLLVKLETTLLQLYSFHCAHLTVPNISGLARNLQVHFVDGLLDILSGFEAMGLHPVTISSREAP